MKDKDLILNLINSEAGRFLIGEKGKEPIVKVTKNSYHKFIGFNGKKPILQAVFYTFNRIEQIFAPIIEKQRIASDKYLDRILQNKYESFLHFSGLEKSSYLPQIYLDTITPTPVAAGSGNVRGPGNSAWATEHDATDGLAANAAAYCIAANYGVNNNNIYRAFAPYDTSSLTAGATITAGSNKIAVYVSGITNVDSVILGMVQSTQASSTDLVVADYDTLGTTLGASVAVASLNSGATTDFTFNTTGDGWISKTSYTKIGFRLSPDYNNVEPAGNNELLIAVSGANASVLTVTYTSKDENAYFL